MRVYITIFVFLFSWASTRATNKKSHNNLEFITIGLYDSARTLYLTANQDYQILEAGSPTGSWNEAKTIILNRAGAKTLIKSSPATIESMVVASPPSLTSSSQALKFVCLDSSGSKVLIKNFDSKKFFKGDYKNSDIKIIKKQKQKPCLFMLKSSRLDKNPYNIFRGNIIIIPHKNSFTVINELKIEDYLRSVVASEVSYTWPLEALKAQAIAARTYTLAQKGRRKNLGYDLKSGVEDQMYLGYKKENPRINQAVKATQGEFLIDKAGVIVDAYYSSHAGTYSSYPETSWGISPKHYLQAVKEFSTEVKPWELNLTLEQIQEKLKDLRYEKLTAITILKRSPEGRVAGVLISGSQDGSPKHTSLSGEEFRHHLGLRSTNFSMQWITQELVSASPPAVILKTKKNIFEKIFGFMLNEKDPKPALQESSAVKSLIHNLKISGEGYGHGIGLSQYDAKFLAQSGKSYKEILLYYYQGASIVRRVN